MKESQNLLTLSERSYMLKEFMSYDLFITKSQKKAKLS
jgi:hypothetical protein